MATLAEAFLADLDALSDGEDELPQQQEQERDGAGGAGPPGAAAPPPPAGGDRLADVATLTRSARYARVVAAGDGAASRGMMRAWQRRRPGCRSR